MPLVKAVTGPGLIADATTDVRNAPKQIGKSRRDLAAAESELASRSRQLDARTTRGAPPGGRRRARPRRRRRACSTQGSTMLAGATSRTGDVQRAGARAERRDGRRAASSPAGPRRSTQKARLLPTRCSEIRKRVDGLIPAIVERAERAARRAGAAQPAARPGADQHSASSRTRWPRSTASGCHGPRRRRRRAARRSALAAVGGSGSSGIQPAQAGGFAGLDASLADELALAEAAGRQIDARGPPGRAVRGRDEAGRRRRRPARQARPEHRRRAARASSRRALGQARDGVAAVQPQLDGLAGGAQSLLATGGELLDASGAQATPLLARAAERARLGVAAGSTPCAASCATRTRPVRSRCAACTRSSELARASSARAT